MLKGLVSSYVLIAERFLIEKDGVLSVIRIVDVFFVDPAPKDSSSPEKRAALINLLISAKFAPGSDIDPTAKISLLRPSGELTVLPEPPSARPDFSTYPDAPSGVSIALQIPVLTKEMGTHYIIVEINGEEIGRTPFTFSERKTEAPTN